MERHVSPEAMLELADGLDCPGEREHLLACAECRAQLDGLRADLGTLGAVEVPEPPPLYWDALRRQVRKRVEAEPRRRAWGWVWLPAVLAAAGIGVWVDLASVEDRLPTEPRRPLPAWSALPSGEEDSGLQVLQALAAGGQLGALTGCSELEACVEALSDEEASALAEALQTELGEGRDL